MHTSAATESLGIALPQWSCHWGGDQATVLWPPLAWRSGSCRHRSACWRHAVWLSAMVAILLLRWPSCLFPPGTPGRPGTAARPIPIRRRGPRAARRHRNWRRTRRTTSPEASLLQFQSPGTRTLELPLPTCPQALPPLQRAQAAGGSDTTGYPGTAQRRRATPLSNRRARIDRAVAVW